MLITDLTRTAMRIAYDGHYGQVDKGGVPYICHPLHVADQMNTESRAAAAILHDLLEDTDITAEDLLAEGIPSEVVDTVKLLTRKKTEPYRDYIRHIAESGNADAIAVKYADLCHNLDQTRIESGRLGERFVKRYTEAKTILEPLLSN